MWTGVTGPHWIRHLTEFPSDCTEFRETFPFETALGHGQVQGRNRRWSFSHSGILPRKDTGSFLFSKKPISRRRRWLGADYNRHRYGRGLAGRTKNRTQQKKKSRKENRKAIDTHTHTHTHTPKKIFIFVPVVDVVALGWLATESRASSRRRPSARRHYLRPSFRYRVSIGSFGIYWVSLGTSFAFTEIYRRMNSVLSDFNLERNWSWTLGFQSLLYLYWSPFLLSPGLLCFVFWLGLISNTCLNQSLLGSISLKKTFLSSGYAYIDNSTRVPKEKWARFSSLKDFQRKFQVAPWKYATLYKRTFFFQSATRKDSTPEGTHCTWKEESRSREKQSLLPRKLG